MVRIGGHDKAFSVSGQNNVSLRKVYGTSDGFHEDPQNLPMMFQQKPKTNSEIFL